jgi:hypothetical protein
MNRSFRFAFAALALAGTAACGERRLCSSTAAAPADNAKREATSGEARNGASAPSSAAAANRAISEADIVQLDDEQDRIYAISKSGTLAVVDATRPGQLSLMGKIGLSGEPFEMYRRGNTLLTMSNKAVGGDGNVKSPLPEDTDTLYVDDPTSGAAINAVDVSVPGSMRTLASFKVPGEIADSRIVGSILYVATYENASCWNCGSKPRTLVTTFDVSTPTAPRQVDQISFESDIAPSPSLQTPWRRSISATKDRLYIGGLAANAQTTTEEGVIEVIDISDPTGRLTRGTRITTAGPVMSRWQMDETAGYLRVVSQRGVSRTLNGEAYPDIDVFRVESSASIVRVGHTTMSLPRQEGLKSVRFDAARAYVITAYTEPTRTHDPLFAIDLTDPTRPVQGAGLEIPGWVFHIEPRGDRLLALGLDRNHPQGSLNVSLFDVSNLKTPGLVQRVHFGPRGMFADSQVTSAVLAEDQDRIQKAFRIFQDGLIAVPFSSGNGSCGTAGGGVQLLRWTRDSLTTSTFLELPGNPRRAVRRDSPSMQELIAISDSNVRAFALNQANAQQPLADVVIGHCVPRTVDTSGLNGVGRPMGDDMMMGDDVATARGSRGTGLCY